MKKRAYRRRQYRLRKTLWFQRLLEWEYPHQGISEETLKHLDWLARFRANTGTSCSCWSCGNPRKHFGEPTKQEKRSLESFKQQLIEHEEGQPRYPGRLLK